MLAILVVYLTPSEQPGFNDGWGRYNDGSWTRSPAALRCGVLLWTAAAAVVVLTARRAAWDLAAASGDLSGPDDVHAFEVLAPGALQAARASDVPAAPLLAMPLSGVSARESAGGSWTPDGPIPAQPLDAAHMPPASVAAAAARPSPMDHLTAAELLGNRRDWEMVLLALMVLLLLVAVDVVAGSRDLRNDLYNPKALSETYERFSNGGPVWSWVAPTARPTKPDTTAGTLAVAAHAADLLILVLSLCGVLWVSICLMSGPRWRRTVIMLLALAAVLLLYDAFATSFLLAKSVASRYLDDRVFQAIPLEAGIVPLMLIVVLARPAVQSLFDQRVRNRWRNTRNANG